MEDAATAEISRSQVWQWLRHDRVTRADVERVLDEEAAQLAAIPRADEARALFEQVALAEDFPEFLTIPAYDHID
jgi:malate synthase